jgi:hypothetical protein
LERRRSPVQARTAGERAPERLREDPNDRGDERVEPVEPVELYVNHVVPLNDE